MVEVKNKDLRVLLFWAAAGVSMSYGGSFNNLIVELIELYRQKIKMWPSSFASYPPKWRTPELLSYKKVMVKDGKPERVEVK